MSLQVVHKTSTILHLLDFFFTIRNDFKLNHSVAELVEVEKKPKTVVKPYIYENYFGYQLTKQL